MLFCENPIADGSYEQYVTADVSLSYGYHELFGADNGLLGVTNNIDFGEGPDITDAVLIINENHADPVTTSTFGGPDPRFPKPQYGRYVPGDINPLVWQGVNIPIPGAPNDTGNPIDCGTDDGSGNCFPFQTLIRITNVRVPAAAVPPAVLELQVLFQVTANLHLSPSDPDISLNLAVDPTNPAAIYGVGNSGVLKSTDGGETWVLANNGIVLGLPPTGITGILIDPTSPSTIYATIGVFGQEGEGVFKSTNGGASWEPVNNGLVPDQDHRDVRGIAMHAASPNTLYITGPSGLGTYKTTDGGANWIQVDTALGFTLAIDPAHLDTVYLGGPFSRLDKSTDGGATWGDSSTGITDFFVEELVVDPSEPTTIYARTDGGAPDVGVAKSTDGGANWAPMNTGLPTEAVGKSVGALGLDPTETETLYAGTPDGVFKTTDGGASWGPANSGIPPGFPGRVNSFAFATPPFFTQLQTLGSMVQGLVAPTGPLSKGQANSLAKELNQAIGRLNKDQREPACGALQDFIDRVNAHVVGGVLSPAQADPLTSLSQAIRSLIPCPV